MTYISGYSLDRLRGFNGGAHHTRIAGVVTQRGCYCCLLLWIPDIIKHPEYPSFRANVHRCDLCFSLRGAIAPPLCDSPSVYGNHIRVKNPVYIDMCIFWIPPCRAWPRFYEGSWPPGPAKGQKPRSIHTCVGKISSVRTQDFPEEGYLLELRKLVPPANEERQGHAPLTCPCQSHEANAIWFGAPQECLGRYVPCFQMLCPQNLPRALGQQQRPVHDLPTGAASW